MKSLLFRWPWSKRKRVLPSYSRFRSVVLADLAPDLAAAECSDSHQTYRDSLERRIIEGSERPAQDRELFAVLVDNAHSGVITITSPSQQPVLAVFTSPIRAADYSDEVLAHGAAPNCQILSSTGLLELLSSLRSIGIQSLALVRCPRCPMFGVVTLNADATADTLISLWAISKATELARLNLYLNHAKNLALAARFSVACQVAYETCVHVAPDNPQVHLLLGELAIALKDRRLLGEAETFLHFLKCEAFEEKLRRDAQAGTPDFTASELSTPV